MRCWRKGVAGLGQRVQGVGLARMEVVLQDLFIIITITWVATCSLGP